MKKIALITTDVEFKKGVLHSYNLCFNSILICNNKINTPFQRNTGK